MVDNDDNSDDYTDDDPRWYRPCEMQGCENEVLISSTTVFCEECLSAAQQRVEDQRQRELAERRAS